MPEPSIPLFYTFVCVPDSLCSDRRGEGLTCCAPAMPCAHYPHYLLLFSWLTSLSPWKLGFLNLTFTLTWRPWRALHTSHTARLSELSLLICWSTFLTVPTGTLSFLSLALRGFHKADPQRMDKWLSTEYQINAAKSHLKFSIKVVAHIKSLNLLE